MAKCLTRIERSYWHTRIGVTYFINDTQTTTQHISTWRELIMMEYAEYSVIVRPIIYRDETTTERAAIRETSRGRTYRAQNNVNLRCRRRETTFDWRARIFRTPTGNVNCQMRQCGIKRIYGKITRKLLGRREFGSYVHIYFCVIKRCSNIINLRYLHYGKFNGEKKHLENINLLQETCFLFVINSVRDISLDSFCSMYTLTCMVSQESLSSKLSFIYSFLWSSLGHLLFIENLIGCQSFATF